MLTRRLSLMLAVLAVVSILYFLSGGTGRTDGLVKGDFSVSTFDKSALGLADNVLVGGSIAPKLGNETAKAELGRAAWKVLHTMVSRFPEKPTPSEQEALRAFITLFSRLYPCGECAAHFRKLLKKYPVQVSSRNAAVGWACFAHNVVNERLGKEIFDCTAVDDKYDCGCTDSDAAMREGKDTRLELD